MATAPAGTACVPTTSPKQQQQDLERDPREPPPKPPWAARGKEAATPCLSPESHSHTRAPASPAAKPHHAPAAKIPPQLHPRPASCGHPRCSKGHGGCTNSHPGMGGLGQAAAAAAGRDATSPTATSKHVAGCELRHSTGPSPTARWSISPALLLFQAERSPREGAYQFLEEVAHGDVAVPLLHLWAQAVIELLVDLVDVLDLVENCLDLLEGEDRLRRSGCGLQWLHRLPKEKGEHLRGGLGGEVTPKLLQPHTAARGSPNSRSTGSPATARWAAMATSSAARLMLRM